MKMQETEDVGKRRRRKTDEMGRMKWNYQINPMVHTKITVLSMVLYLCHRLCVHLSFLLKKCEYLSKKKCKFVTNKVDSNGRN